MNDRYLFRAKRKNWKELPKEYWWVEGYYAHLERQDREVILVNKGGVLFVDIDPSTICQCTGLKDKNGKLIWENDIVRHYNNPNIPDEYDEGIVKWNNVRLRFERTSIMAKENVGINSSCIYEVIGNTFDNPELMEGEM